MHYKVGTVTSIW